MFAHGIEAALQPPHLLGEQIASVGFYFHFFHGETLILWEEGGAQFVTAACWGLASHVSSVPGALPPPPHPGARCRMPLAGGPAVLPSTRR